MIVIKYKKKPKIVQMQITDYINGVKVEVYEMWDGKIYQRARKKFEPWLPVTKRKKKAPPLPAGQLTLEQYFLAKIVEKIPKPPYWKRFPSIPQATFKEFASGVITRGEWNELQDSPDFTGYFNLIFEVNDLSFFNRLQTELEAGGVTYKGNSIYDVIAVELLRHQLGLRNYAGSDKVRWVTGVNPLVAILHNPDHFPTAADVSYVLKKLPPERVMDFFHALVRECIELGIIDPRVLIWDGHFVRSNSNNNKPDGSNSYSDPDAGYCRHLGVKKGVGYDPGFLYAYCGAGRVLPVHFTMFPGNRNDNPAFRATLGEFLDLGIGNWIFCLSDTGAYSKASLEYCIFREMLPVIRARKNLKSHPTRETKDGYWFNTDYIPTGWTDADYSKLYEVRPMVEKAFSPRVTFYNVKRLNTRGEAMATIHCALTCILDLLRALTARKLGRPDLAGKLTAFSTTREAETFRKLEKVAREMGFFASPLSSAPFRQI